MELNVSEVKIQSIVEKYPIPSNVCYNDYINHISGDLLTNSRENLFKTCGIAFPFPWNTESKRLGPLILQTVNSITKSTPIRNIILNPQQYCFGKNKTLFWTSEQISADTSQGEVYAVQYRNTDAKFFMIVKSNALTIETNIWYDPNKPTILTSNYSGRSYHVLGSGYMDAFCASFLSNKVERGIIPHFPIVYGTTINKLLRSEGPNTPIESTDTQLIWMEYLPDSLWEVLEKETNIHFWLSQVFQSCFTLGKMYEEFGFIHGDCHSENVRIRHVTKDLKGQYKVIILDKKTGSVVFEYYYIVPYYGAEVCFIDFGRSVICPFGKDKPGFISSEFYNGRTKNYVPDNHTADLVRLFVSVYSRLKKNIPSPESDSLSKLFEDISTTDQGVKLTEGLKNFSKLKTENQKSEFLEVQPRKFCHSKTGANLMHKFLPIFGVPKSKINPSVPIFELVYAQ
jgi:hypothetical protein